MKRILISMMTIALVSALVAGGIYAGFLDTEEGDIEFRAGTLDLTVGGKSGEWTLAVEGLILDDEGEEGPFKLRNIGSIDGLLTIEFDAADTTEVRGTRGKASADGTINTLVDTDLKLSGRPDGYWVGFYLTLYSEEPLLREDPKRVTGYDSNTGTLEIHGTFDSGVANQDQRYALQTEHERHRDDHKDLDEDFLQVAFKVGPNRFLDPASTGYVTVLADAWGDLSDFADKEYGDFITIEAGQTIDFTAYWKTADSDLIVHANPYQGAGVAVPVTFTLNQIDP